MSSAIRIPECEDSPLMVDSRYGSDDLVRVDTYGGGGDAAWRSVDWREHQRWVTLPGGPVSTIELGSGPPIVFVHGLGGSWTNFLEQLPEFARDHRVLTLDLPGFGASPLPEGEDVSIPAQADVVAAVMAERGIEEATVVGNSMGGFIAAEMALRHPERLERLVLISAAGISSERLKIEPLAVGFRMTAGIAAWVGTHSHELTRRPRARKFLVGQVVRHPNRLEPPLVAEMVRGSGTPGFTDALVSLCGYPIEHRLEDVRAPTLVIWGEKDRIVPPKDAPRFEAAIPGARLVRFADTGHMPQVERPEAFNELLRDFLRETSEGVTEEGALPASKPSGSS
jgi:pimeloyl-ACP methyl ester carboxylesterase